MSDFDEFWAAYPRHKGKGAAREAFKRALKKADIETILTGVANLRAEVAHKHTETQFIPHASTWLNQERWEDEYELPPRQEDQEALKAKHREMYQRMLERTGRA